MSQKDRSPLVILGFDAGDPHLLQRWQQEGRLPTLASIMANGCWTETGGCELLFEHGVWQTIFSGISRANSGHYYFRQLVPGAYDLRLVTAAHIEGRPFWNCFTGGHGRVFIADVPDVLPLPGIDGVQIANWAIHRGWRSRDPAELPMTQPRRLLGELRKLVGPPEVIIENPAATPRQDLQIFQRLLARVQRKGSLCRQLIRNQGPDVIAIVFGESHSAGHQFWKYRRNPARASSVSPELIDATRTIYEAIDHEMGLLLRELPNDCNVVVLSSVGLTDHYPTGQLLESFCRQLGYQAAPHGSNGSLRPADRLRQLIPETWRIAVSRHFTRETRERLFAQQFRSGTDFSRTSAFAIPSIYTGFIQINLRGREPSGMVEPGREYESILQRIEADLAQLIDPVTGKEAIEKVIRTSDLFGEDALSRMPDLIVHWQPVAHFVGRVVHPKCEFVQVPSEFNRDSDHYEHGFLAATGPNIARRGRLSEIDVIDLAPTFLELLGLPKGSAMNGRVLRELLGP